MERAIVGKDNKEDKEVANYRMRTRLYTEFDSNAHPASPSHRPCSLASHPCDLTALMHEDEIGEGVTFGY